MNKSFFRGNQIPHDHGDKAIMGQNMKYLPFLGFVILCQLAFAEEKTPSPADELLPLLSFEEVYHPKLNYIFFMNDSSGKPGKQEMRIIKIARVTLYKEQNGKKEKILWLDEEGLKYKGKIVCKLYKLKDADGYPNERLLQLLPEREKRRKAESSYLYPYKESDYPHPDYDENYCGYGPIMRTSKEFYFPFHDQVIYDPFYFWSRRITVGYDFQEGKRLYVQFQGEKLFLDLDDYSDYKDSQDPAEIAAFEKRDWKNSISTVKLFFKARSLRARYEEFLQKKPELKKFLSDLGGAIEKKDYQRVVHFYYSNSGKTNSGQIPIDTDTVEFLTLFMVFYSEMENQNWSAPKGPGRAIDALPAETKEMFSLYKQYERHRDSQKDSGQPKVDSNKSFNVNEAREKLLTYALKILKKSCIPNEHTLFELSDSYISFRYTYPWEYQGPEIENVDYHCTLNYSTKQGWYLSADEINWGPDAIMPR